MALKRATSSHASMALVGGRIVADGWPDTAPVRREYERYRELRRTMNIHIDAGVRVIMATLDDNETSRDFVSLLPRTLTLTDYAATEKISDLPRRLSTQGVPSGSDLSVGDIAYYAPCGNLALFYRDAPYARGLVRLGRIDGSVDALRRTGSVSAKIDLVRGQAP